MNVAVARTAKIVDPIAALASEDAVGAAEAAPPESPAAPRRLRIGRDQAASARDRRLLDRLPRGHVTRAR